jgi:metal-responsive CopG/Arc/MetJ family transcriptional regulator
MLNNSRVSFRINFNLWKRFCEVSEIYGINKSEFLRSKIIEFLQEKLNKGGGKNDHSGIY